MSFSDCEIEIEDELWEAAVRASGVTDPSELANLVSREMLDRLKRQRGEIADKD